MSGHRALLLGRCMPPRRLTRWANGKQGGSVGDHVRHRVARARSDHADAMALANILRTDAEMHRPLPADSELVQAIAVLARAQQDAVWNRGQLSNQLRSHLKQYFPAALAAFHVRGIGLDSREARAVLALAPDPSTAATLTPARLRTVLRKSGRQRNIDAWANRLR